MKRTKEELKTHVSEILADNVDIAIEIIEDIEDSFDVTDSEELSRVKNELEEFKRKYMERFLNNTDDKEVIDEIDETIEVDEIVDVKEI